LDTNLLQFLQPLREQIDDWADGLDFLDVELEARILGTLQGSEPSFWSGCSELYAAKGEEVVDTDAYDDEVETEVDDGTRLEREWRRELLHGNVYDGLEEALLSAKAERKSALCIWFHGVTGKGADWEPGLKDRIAGQLPWVGWYFPDAPKRPVEHYSGKIESCWFDQLEGQVTESMATPGLEVSVSMVHSLLRQAKAHGFPPNRIFLGGFSQGGVLAMAAGFSYRKILAGIVAVGAWVPPCVSQTMRQPSTPLMYTTGDQDKLIPLTIFQKGVKKLRQTGCCEITTKVYPGLGHGWTLSHCQFVKEFIESVQSSTTDDDTTDTI
jgi:phospholipase/carboxylesterase